MPLSDILIKIGAKNTASREINRVGRELSGLARTAATAALGFVGLRSVFDGLGRSLKELDDLAKTSRKLGLNANDLKALQFAAAETAGMVDGQFNMALQRMTRRIAEAAAGTGEAVKAIKELGLNAEALNQLSPDAAFRRIADAMQDVSGESNQLRIAFKLFDSEGASLVNTLKIGSGALEEYGAEAAKVFGTFSNDQLAKIEAANDSIQRLTESFKSLFREFAVNAAPSLEWASDFGTSLFRGARDPQTFIDAARYGLFGRGAAPSYMTTKTDPFRLGGDGGHSVIGSAAKAMMSGQRQIISSMNTLLPKIGKPLMAFDSAVNSAVLKQFTDKLFVMANVFTGKAPLAGQDQQNAIHRFLQELYAEQAQRPTRVAAEFQGIGGPGFVNATLSRVMGRAPGRSFEVQAAQKREKQLAEIDANLKQANELNKQMIEKLPAGPDGQFIFEGVA